jgi:hypothetical protein
VRYATLIAPVLAIALVGCGSKNDELVMHPVTGKVTYDGKAAAGVHVTLIPSDAPMVPKIPQNPHAVTKADGTFSIGTFAEADGAAEGGYQLVLAWPVDQAAKAAKGEKVDSSDEAQDADQLLGWYDALHSRISVRVKSGSNEVPAIDIPRISSPPPSSQGVPGRN